MGEDRSLEFVVKMPVNSLLLRTLSKKQDSRLNRAVLSTYLVKFLFLKISNLQKSEHWAPACLSLSCFPFTDYEQLAMCISSSCPVTGGGESLGCWGGADSSPPFPMTLPMNGDIREKSIHRGRYYSRGTLSASTVHFRVQSITQIWFSGVIIIYSLHIHIESQNISFHLGWAFYLKVMTF